MGGKRNGETEKDRFGFAYPGLLPAACKRAGETDGAKKPEAVFADNFSCVTERGGLFFGNTEKVYFYDSENDQVYPLCARPNCTHSREEGCLAARIWNPAIYEDGLYYMRVDENGRQGFYRADVDGENERKLTEFEYDLPGFLGVFFLNGKAYMQAGEYSLEGTPESPESVRRSQILLAVDLESGEEKVLDRIECGEDGTATWNPVYAGEGRICLNLEAYDLPEGSGKVSGSYYLDTEKGELEPAGLEPDVTVVCGDGDREICYEVADREENGEEKNGSYWLRTSGSEEMEKIGDVKRRTKAILVDDGVFYDAYEEDYRTGEQRFYRWEDQTTEIIQQYGGDPESFHVEGRFWKDGEEMLFGTYAEREEGDGKRDGTRSP